MIRVRVPERLLHLALYHLQPLRNSTKLWVPTSIIFSVTLFCSCSVYQILFVFSDWVRYFLHLSGLLPVERYLAVRIFFSWCHVCPFVCRLTSTAHRFYLSLRCGWNINILSCMNWSLKRSMLNISILTYPSLWTFLLVT